MITANIGLAVSTDPNHADNPAIMAAIVEERAATAIAMLEGEGDNNIAREDWRIAQSATEPTLVVNISNFSRERLYEVALALRQDCVAIRDEYLHGELIGPSYALWAPFDNAHFIGLQQ